MNPPFSASAVLSTALLGQPAGTPLNTYAVDQLDSTCLIVGGWKDAAAVGPDRLYRTSNTWTDDPVELTWPVWNPSNGYHVNDASCIAPASDDGVDRTSWRYIYATGLANGYATPADMQYRNISLLLYSGDYGATWTYHSEVIPQYNGIDNTGAWAPSALNLDNPLGTGPRIGLWHHCGSKDVVTNAATNLRVMRRLVRANGWQQDGYTIICGRPDIGTTYPVLLTNVDVDFGPNGRLWMVGNSVAAGGEMLRCIDLLYSDDIGVSWHPWKTGHWSTTPERLIDGSGAGAGIQYVCPKLQWVNDTQVCIRFSQQNMGGAYGVTGTFIHEWVFQLS